MVTVLWSNSDKVIGTHFDIAANKSTSFPLNVAHCGFVCTRFVWWLFHSARLHFVCLFIHWKSISIQLNRVSQVCMRGHTLTVWIEYNSFVTATSTKHEIRLLCLDLKTKNFDFEAQFTGANIWMEISMDKIDKIFENCLNIFSFSATYKSEKSFSRSKIQMNWERFSPLTKTIR